MKKKLVTEERETFYIQDLTAEEAVKEIKDLITKYAPNKVSFSKEYEPYSDGNQYIAVNVEREETDEEAHKRENTERLQNQSRENYERQQYLVLQKKYGEV